MVMLGVASERQVRKCRLRYPVSLCGLILCKRLLVVVPVRLAGRHVISGSLHSHLTQPLGSPDFVRTVGSDEVVSGPQYFAYAVEDLGSELLPVVDQNVVGAPHT